MKRHNKKRNSAFLYEVLVREMTRSIIQKNTRRSTFIKNLIRERFHSSTCMGSELGCYTALIETSGLDTYTAEKMIHRTKLAYSAIDKNKLFQEQSSTIKDINTHLGSGVYHTFVPNYRSYATVAQIFGEKAGVKEKILLEKKILEQLTSNEKPSEKLQPVDSLVVTKFTEKFNQQYKDLLPEQAKLLQKYILSFNDEGADFRSYLVTELKRLHTVIKDSLTLTEVIEDQSMVDATNRVLETLEAINVSRVDTKEILRVLKAQQLVREYGCDDT